MTANEILKKYWGFDSFRLNQAEIVSSAINGYDTFALLPTGGGKSICFQVPGLARDGICIVVSPLIALMQDQVKNLSDRGVKAYAITSGMNKREIDIILDNCKFGNVKFLYVSPERLKTQIFITRFKQMKVGLIAIDEAHCISEWGHDFRPPYLDIHELRTYHPDVPMIAVTATATERVKEDIKTQLKLRNPNNFEGDFSRANISYEIYKVKNKTNAIISACKKFHGMSGIVYCQTRKDTKIIAKMLIDNGFSAGIYNGGMDNDTRKQQLQYWMDDKIRIMVATNAFGMGIDKPDVRFVLHYELPNNLEAYFQEAGRSGRDGKTSRNLGFYEEQDIHTMQQKLELQFPEIETIKLIYKALCNYLSIAIGSGENETYNLELNSFAKKYNLNLLEVYNALKILELNQTISFSEGVFQPTKLKFIIENKTLYNFQIKNTKFDPLITLISRSHPGVFSDFQKINEKKLSQVLKTSENEIKNQLSHLEKQGIIDINWKSDSPKVTFIHERLPDEYFSIKKDVYKLRKQVAFDKLEGMLNFLQKPICRSILLLEYFGQSGEKCNKCDICLEEQKSNYTNLEVTNAILETLETTELSIIDLQNQMEHIKEDRFKSIIHDLLEREVLVYNYSDSKLKINEIK